MPDDTEPIDAPEPDGAGPVAEVSGRQVALHGQAVQLVANQYVGGLASAEVLTAEDVESLVAATGIPEEFATELDNRIQTVVSDANSSFFRFDIRFVDEIREAQTIELTNGTTVASPLLTASFCKLVILLPLWSTGDLGDASVLLPAFGKRRPLQLGAAYVYPAFAELAIETRAGVTLTGLVLTATGPAFR